MLFSLLEAPTVNSPLNMLSPLLRSISNYAISSSPSSILGRSYERAVRFANLTSGGSLCPAFVGSGAAYAPEEFKLRALVELPAVSVLTYAPA